MSKKNFLQNKSKICKTLTELYCKSNLVWWDLSRKQGVTDTQLHRVKKKSWCTFCLSGHCPCQSEGSQRQTAHCRQGFPHPSGGPPHLHPRLRRRGRALSRCAARHRSDRPGPSACWRPTGYPSAQSGHHCHCVDCAARPHCRLQTAPVRRRATVWWWLWTLYWSSNSDELLICFCSFTSAAW